MADMATDSTTCHGEGVTCRDCAGPPESTSVWGHEARHATFVRRVRARTVTQHIDHAPYSCSRLGIPLGFDWTETATGSFARLSRCLAHLQTAFFRTAAACVGVRMTRVGWLVAGSMPHPTRGTHFGCCSERSDFDRIMCGRATLPAAVPARRCACVCVSCSVIPAPWRISTSEPSSVAYSSMAAVLQMDGGRR